MIVNIQDDPTGRVVAPIKPSVEPETFQTDQDFQTYLSEFESVKTELFKHYSETIKVKNTFAGHSLSLEAPHPMLSTEGVQMRYKKKGTIMGCVAFEPEGINVAAYALTAFRMEMFDRLARLTEMRVKKNLQSLATLKPLGKALTIPDGEKLFDELKDLVFSWYYKRPRQITPENQHFSIETRFEETGAFDEDGDPVSTMMVDVKFHHWTFSMKQFDSIGPVESTERIIYAWERQL